MDIAVQNSPPNHQRKWNISSNVVLSYMVSQHAIRGKSYAVH